MNIIGEGFPNEIIKQVSVRQVVHGLGYKNSKRTVDSHLYKNSNTAWCRLVSATDIVNKKSLVNTNIKNLGPSYNNDRLARDFVLFNGTSNHSLLNDRSGLGLNGQHAYSSWGKTFPEADLGFRPMAGITSVSVKHKNQGSLRNAVINIKAWDKLSFEIIDVLYLRIGFSVLLEWGHSMYYDNNGELTIDPNNNDLMEKFLDGDTSYYNFLKLIDKKRLSTFGNYDAMFGIVTNFHWSYQPDGSYDIVLNLSSSGEIIESFKIKGNTLNNPPTDDEIETPVGLDYYDMDKVIETFASTNDINAFLYKKWAALKTTGYDPGVATGYPNPKYCLTDGSAVRMFPDLDFSGGTTYLFVRLGDLLKYIQDEVLYKVINKSSESAKFLYIDTDENSNLMHAPDKLMSYDPRVCMVRRYTYFEKSEEKVKEETTYDVTPTEGSEATGQGIPPSSNTTPENNNPYYEDPNSWGAWFDKVTGVVKVAVGAATQNPDLIAEGATQYASNTEEAINAQNAENKAIGLDGTYDIANFDPSVEYFSRPYGGINYTDSNYIKKFMSESEKEIGKIMNIYVNFRFIMAKLQELTETNTNSVDLYSFLKELVANINGAFCGYSKLDLWIDESTNTLKIIDQNPLPSSAGTIASLRSKGYNINSDTAYFSLSSYKNISYPSGNVDDEGNEIMVDLPYAGFIRDFRFDTEFPPEYATIVQVSSTSGGNVKGENNTALSKINRGLRDRFKTKIIGGGNQTDNDPNKRYENYTAASAEYDSAYRALSSYLGHIYVNVYIDAEIDDLKATATVVHKLYKKLIDAKNEYYSDKPKSKIPVTFQPGTGFIPFNLSLTMDGLAGMKIFSRFEIDASYLPSNYPNTVDFIIKAVNHEIKDNQWITKIESMTIAKGNASTKPAIVLTPKTIDNIVSNGGTNTYTNDVKNPVVVKNYEQISDKTLFSYLVHQQGLGGALQHYKVAKGIMAKYEIGKPNLYQNWPGADRATYTKSKWVAKNGVTLSKLRSLYKSDPKALAFAFIDVQRQLFAKKYYEVLPKTNFTSGKNDQGFSFQKLYHYAEKYATPTLTKEIILAIMAVEHSFQIDSPQGAGYQGLFQLSKEYYPDALEGRQVEIQDGNGKGTGKYVQINRYEKNGQWVYAKPADFTYYTWQEDEQRGIVTETEKLVRYIIPIIEHKFKRWSKEVGYTQESPDITSGTLTPTQNTPPPSQQNVGKLISTISGYYDLNTLTAHYGPISLDIKDTNNNVITTISADCDALHAFQSTRIKFNKQEYSVIIGDMASDIKKELDRLNGQGINVQPEKIRINFEYKENNQFPKINWSLDIHQSNDKTWEGVAVRGAGCNASVDTRYNDPNAGNDMNSIKTSILNNKSYAKVVTQIEPIPVETSANDINDPSKTTINDYVIYDGAFYDKLYPGNSNKQLGNTFKQAFYRWTSK